MPEIYLDKQKLEELSNRYDTVQECITIGLNYARVADVLRGDSYLFSAMFKGVKRLTEDVKNDFGVIISSFESTDAKLKKEAENIIGPEIYTAIRDNNRVDYDSDGNVVSITPNQTEYSNEIRDYIIRNLDRLKRINEYNYTDILNCNYRGESGWCDAFVDYVIRDSIGEQFSPGSTNSESTWLFEENHWRHGYLIRNGYTWDDFNRYTPTPGADVSNDGYQPQSGDLVWVNWENNGGLATHHVGIFYTDSEGNWRVIDGNSGGGIVQDRSFDEFIQGAGHVSFGSINELINSRVKTE